MSNTKRKPQQRMGMGPRHGGVSTEKANDFKGTMKKLLKYLSKYKVRFFFIILFIAISTIFTIAGPKILSKATTLLANGLMSKYSGGSGIDFEAIAAIMLTLLVIYLISTLFNTIQGFMVSDISQNVTYELRKKLSEKVDRLPLKYFDTTSNGEVLSIVTNDIETISQSLNQSLQQMLSSIITIIGVLIMMLTINVTMTLVAVLMVPMSLFTAKSIIKHSQKYFIAQQEILGHANGHIEEMYGGHLVMKAFNGEEKSIKQFSKFNDGLYDAGWKSQFYSGLMRPIASVIGNIGYVLVVILGGFLSIKKAIEIGDILAFTQYIRSFNQPISQVAQIMSVLQSTAAASERVFKFLEEEEEDAEVENPINIYDKNKNINVKGQVCFENINFGYLKNTPVINDFSAYIAAGKQVAIVGPTGAGKTTIVKLLLRFYELNSGDIYIDNHKTTEYNKNDLRAVFGMVLQDASLFSGTIMENIRYGRLDATDQEVIQAAKEAHVDHFVNTLEDCYNTVINEESSNISQGQKQLITIARALLKDPKILILDEATSSVDTRTEQIIQHAMDKLMKDRTSFVIAHRLSTIKNADMILVMDEGDIVEVGNHEDLLIKDGFYAKLYNSQFDIIE
jgi:ATP-binding cassette subfamily B protein